MLKLTDPVIPARTRHSEAPVRSLNILALVHLRNIYQSTGAGRVARQLTEHLAACPDTKVSILADLSDHARIVPQVGAPWTSFDYRFFRSETSQQQAKWFLLNRPVAEHYLPEAQIMFCTAESYVPVKRARLAITLHDAAYFEDDAHRRDSSFSRQRFKWQMLYRKMLRNADLFHTVSQFSADRLAHFFPTLRSRLRVVHNAVTPHFFEPSTKEGCDYVRQQGLADRPFILVPGGLHFRKNAELIFEGWPLLKSLHPELQLAVVNHSSPEYAERAAQFGADLRMLGFVSDEALRALYSSAQAIWFPSRYEGFGLPVIEAMACGAPVVASRASSLPEIAGDAGLLASPTKASEHVDLLHSVLTSASLRSDLSLRGSARAKTFTWARSAEQLRGEFEKLL